MEQIVLTIPLQTVATLVFYLTAIIFIVFSLIMYYHWSAYSPDKKVSRITLILYLATNVPLLIALGVSTLFI